MRRWLLFDFAGVLAEHQSGEAKAAMTAAAQRPGDTFWAAYWEHRPSYDAGAVSARQYWAAVTGRNPEKLDERGLRELVGLDVDSWLEQRRDVMAILAERAGPDVGLALLSNAPIELAAAVDDLPWLGHFSHRLFSSRMGSIKPDAVCFQAALGVLGAAPEQVLFVDDRAVNVTGAQRAGMSACLYVDPPTLRRDIQTWLAPAPEKA